MDKKELRIGNYAKGINVGFVKTVGDSCAFKTPTTTIRIATEDLEPIPLTEEWLLKFGFKQIDKYTFVYKSRFIHHRKRGFVFGSKKLETNIKHVHQLQNLYFSLTNEELKNN